MAGDWESRFRQAVAGIVEAGVSVSASTAELWAEIRGAAAEAGLTIGQQGFQIVNDLRAGAAARRRGYEAFQGADPASEFGMHYAAPEMNIRPDSVRSIMPEYMVRFDLTYLDTAGNEVTRTVSLRDRWLPDMTVGDVHDAVAEAAEGLSTDYGQGLIGFSNMRPVTI